MRRGRSVGRMSGLGVSFWWLLWCEEGGIEERRDGDAGKNVQCEHECCIRDEKEAKIPVREISERRRIEGFFSKKKKRRKGKEEKQTKKGRKGRNEKEGRNGGGREGGRVMYMQT